MSKQEAIIKGLGSKQMGRITVLDAGYVEDESAEGQEFMAAMQGETRGLREEEVVRGVVVEIRGKDVIIDIGYKGSGTVNLDEFNNPTAPRACRWARWSKCSSRCSRTPTATCASAASAPRR